MRARPVPAIAAALLLACQDFPQPSEPRFAGGAKDTLFQTSLSADPAGAASLTAEVEFGSEHVGSPFPPESHDNSFKAIDRLRPLTVVIQRGGSVTYQIAPCHQPAVYGAGTTPDDIAANVTEPIGVTGCPPDRINDPNGRIALAPPQSSVSAVWTTPPGTFDQPGTYLVICTTQVHFLFARMYGWVIVK
jgi:hypothetical protein